MKVKTGKIRKEKCLNFLLLFFMIALLIEPDGMAQLSPFFSKAVWRVFGRYIDFVVISIFFWIKCERRLVLHLSSYFVLFFVLLSGVITLLNGKAIISWFSNYGNVFFLCLLVEACRKNLPDLIKAALLYFEILIYVNLICMILYPNGMYYSASLGYALNWLLGYKSSFQYYIVPAIALAWLNARYTGKKLRFIILLAICLAETVWSQNMMLLVGEAILILIIIFKLYERTGVFNGQIYLIAAAAVNVIVLFFTTVLTLTQIGQMFLSALNKSETLSGRVSIIWPRAMEYIKQKPWLGYGALSSTEHSSMLGGSAAIHAHNQALELLFSGGIVLLVVFIVFLVFIGKKAVEERELESTKVLSACVFIVLIMISSEVFTRWIGVGIWLLFLLEGRCSQIDRQFQNYPKKKHRKKKIKLVLNLR